MTSDMARHSLSARLAACALLTVLFSAAAFAQSATSQTPAPKANLIIEQKAILFDLRGSARSWQLEVFNQPGDLIFASGVVNQQTVEWALNDQQEKPLADGLYVYTLKFWDENNQQVSVQARSHSNKPSAASHQEQGRRSTPPLAVTHIIQRSHHAIRQEQNGRLAVRDNSRTVFELQRNSHAGQRRCDQAFYGTDRRYLPIAISR